jgi:import inner membrane translocase subunit TIM16
MAVGPFARILAQFVVPVVAMLARAIPAAYGQALQNARKAGIDATEASAPVFGKRISRSEALQVLNLKEKEITPDAIQKVSINILTDCTGVGIFQEIYCKCLPYSSRGAFNVCWVRTNPSSSSLSHVHVQQQFDRYYAANDVSKGGSYYLQSKIYRAKELLTEYQTEKKIEEQEERKQQSNNEKQ